MMQLKLNRWLIVLLALMMLVLVFKVDKKQPLLDDSSTLPDSDYFMKGVVIRQFDSQGTQISTLAADKMEHSLDQDRSFLDKPLITFNSSQTGIWQLRSENGELLKHKQIIQLENDVQIVEYKKSQQGSTRISTNNLLIDLGNSVAQTKQDVFIESPFYKTKSTGLSIDFKQEIILLISDVTTEIFQ